MITEEKEYTFIIDTTDYSGNFEREMCAYLTGHVGECEVGSKYADDDVHERFETKIVDKQDDHGCYRPTSIYTTPGYSNNGTGNFTKVNDESEIKYPAYLSVGIFFENEISQEDIDFMKQRAYEFAKMKNIKITGFRSETIETTCKYTYKNL